MITYFSLIEDARRRRASDIHLSEESPIRYRVDGELQNAEVDLSPLEIKEFITALLSDQQKARLFSEDMDFALEDGNGYRQRINVYYQQGRLAATIRLLNAEIPDIRSLGLPEVLLRLADEPRGLILITGPTGSGKTTTLAAMLNYINETKKEHIITIEDPIEYVHANKRSIIEQRELHADTLSYAGALKNALRQDPDVILVGEMRDTETMAAAITAAETGHLVLATIHTNNAPQTIDRIVDSFPDHQQNQIRLQLAGVLLGVISQRLLPLKDGSGRTAVFEIMVGTSPIQALIRDGKTHLLRSSMETGYKDGMVTMERALAELAAKNIVLPEEIAKLSC